ncbi:hypothetical protein [Sphingomonas abaci]|uniref:Uncharacterized protein n=1 Tax=Sphingomonas abaci TaxID=237611 RepID=A0A7W7ALP7_9SPHN|nr:hypothetical protein [Sphingomonas abaci]MBB4619359.1 hypothetical protein [Sphingomonas abaci]
MTGFHAPPSDRLVLAPSGLRAIAVARTIDVRVFLDPAAPVTAIARPLARRLPGMPPAPDSGTTALPRPLLIRFVRPYADIRRARFVAALPDDALLDLGRDVLGTVTVRLDLKAGQIRRLDPDAAARLADHATRIPVTLRDDGLTMPGQLDGQAVTITFDTAPRDQPPPPATVPVTIAGQTLSARRGADGHVSIGWDAFADRRLVLDLPHGAIWLD